MNTLTYIVPFIICIMLIIAGCPEDRQMKGDNSSPLAEEMEQGLSESEEATPLSGSSPEFKLRGYRIPPDSDDSYSIDTGDIDMDSDIDILIGNYDGQSRVYLNDGEGRFQNMTDSILPNAILPARDARFSDIDGDGDLDIMIANDGASNMVYLYDNGIYIDVTESALPEGSSPFKPTKRVLTGDINRDNYPDLLFINYNLKNMLYYNNGDGTFRDMSLLLPDMRCPALDGILIDIDGDNDLDLLTANNGRCDDGSLFINNSGDGFSSGADVLPSPPIDAISVAASDYNNDGDADIFFVSSGLIYIYSNNNGVFGLSDTIESSVQISRIRMRDIDMDGYDDIVMGIFGGGNRVYLNDRMGGFKDASTDLFSAESDYTRDIAIADMDGDGDPDIAAANNGQNRLYLNNGDGFDNVTTDADLPPDSDSSFMGRLVDIDDDGDPDLVIANFGDDRLYLNNGDGMFSDITATHLPDDNNDMTYAVAVGDIDGDGMVDMAFANDESHNRLYINKGAGRFADVSYNLPDDNDPSHDIDLVDIDDDRDIDIIISNMGIQNRIYINDGRGRFRDETSERFPSDSDISYHAASGDIDRDGDIDLIFANIGSKITLYLNDGDGFFSDGSHLLPDKVSDSDGVALGDLNGDGYLDIFIGNFPFDTRDGIRNWVYLNNGDGSFMDVTETHFPDLIDQTCNVVITDIDNDGDPDLIASNQGQSHLYLNDGNAVFSDVTDLYMPSERDTTRGIEAGDIDGDGDIDMILMNDFDRQNHLYWNMIMN